MEKECELSIGKQSQEGLPRNSAVRVADRPEMMSAVFCGCKATNQTECVNPFQFTKALHIFNKK